MLQKPNQQVKLRPHQQQVKLRPHQRQAKLLPHHRQEKHHPHHQQAKLHPLRNDDCYAEIMSNISWDGFYILMILYLM